MDLSFDEVNEYARLVSEKMLLDGISSREFGDVGNNKGWFLLCFTHSEYNINDDIQTIDNKGFFLGTDGNLYCEKSNLKQYIGGGTSDVEKNTKTCVLMTEDDASLFNYEFIRDETKEGDIDENYDRNLGAFYSGKNQGLYVRLQDLAEIEFKKDSNDYFFSEIKELAKKTAYKLKTKGVATDEYADGKKGWLLYSKYKNKYDRKYKVEEIHTDKYFLGDDGNLYTEISIRTIDNGEELSPYKTSRLLVGYFTAIFNTANEYNIVIEGNYEKKICNNVKFLYTGQNEGLFLKLNEMLNKYK